MWRDLVFKPQIITVNHELSKSNYEGIYLNAPELLQICEHLRSATVVVGSRAIFANNDEAWARTQVIILNTFQQMTIMSAGQ